jgi:hypothetical protein
MMPSRFSTFGYLLSNNLKLKKPFPPEAGKVTVI